MGLSESSGDIANPLTPMKHQYSGDSAGMVFITRFVNRFLHQSPFVLVYWCYDRGIAQSDWLFVIYGD
jgi:hypothetical protein